MDTGSGPYHSLGLDAIFQYTGTGVQLFSGMVFYIIIVRLFSTTGVGAIALFVAIIGLFNIIFSFGLATAAQHFISYNLGEGNYASVRHTVYKILSFGFIFSILGFITVQIFAPDISVIFLHSRSYTELVRILGVVLFGYIMFSILNGILLGIQNFRISAIINIVIWLTYYFGAVFLAIYLKSVDTIVLGWAIGIFIGVVVELFVVTSSLRSYLGKGVAPSSAYLLSYSVPVLLSSLISYGAASADRFVVSGLLNLSALGIYNFSLLLASSLGFMLVPFNNILMPKFSQLYGSNKREEIAPTVYVATTLLSSLFVPAALGIAALAPILLKLLGGTVYVQGSMALRIIMSTGAIFASQAIFSQAIASVRKTKLLFYSSGFALLTNVLVSIMLIPQFGLTGAAIGFSSVYAVIFTALYIFARRERVARIDVVGQLKIWLSSILMFIIVLLVSHYMGSHIYELPIYILVGLAVYLGTSRILQVFKKENKELILSLFPQNLVIIKKMISYLILH